MINLTRLICTISCCSVLVLSCKKNKDEVKSPDPCDRITKVLVHDFSGGTSPDAVVEYDEQGRVKRVTGVGFDETIYSYYKDSIVMALSDIFGSKSSNTLYLDAKGRIKGSRMFDSQYTYNEEGYLVSYRSPVVAGGQITGYYVCTLKYENGDLIEVSIPGSSYAKKINFKYHNEPNPDLLGYYQPLGVDLLFGRKAFWLISAGFWGKQSAHLYKAVAYDDSWGMEIEYKKDAKGRVIRVQTTDFEYQCK